MTKPGILCIIMTMKNKVIIGLMSGTSVDGVDAAAFEVVNKAGIPDIRVIEGISFPIPPDLRALIFELFEDQSGALKKMTLANMRIGHLFADAVETLLQASSLKAEDIEVIGSHGQTIYHVADFEDCCGMNLRGSLQIGEGSVIAQRTGIPTISDFRVADIAAGGSGAPLVPFLDKILARSLGPDIACQDIAFQNIGGVGNVTFIEDNDTEPSAFDTGPGNMIVDHIVSVYTNGKYPFDKDGQFGRRGRINEALLTRWMEHPYLKLLPPKTTGREEFGGDFFRTFLKGLKFDPDLIRTAEEYTVRTISQAYRNFPGKVPGKVIVTGGGAFNPVIMEGLKKELSDSRVMTGDEAGISSEFKEAAAFALMGHYFMESRVNNVKSATGALRPVIMGKLSRP